MTNYLPPPGGTTNTYALPGIRVVSLFDVHVIPMMQPPRALYTSVKSYRTTWNFNISLFKLNMFVQVLCVYFMMELYVHERIRKKRIYRLKRISDRWFFRLAFTMRFCIVNQFLLILSLFIWYFIIQVPQ